MSGTRAVAFVVARLGSSRFPAKQFREVGGRSIIDRIFDELGGCEKLELAVLATVAEESNLPLKEYASRRGVPLFWYEGNPDDVTTRLKLAAEEFGADICLLVSADCPLLHAPSVDAMIERLAGDPEADYVALPPRGPGLCCLLEGVNAARCDAWRRADAMSLRQEDREHQFPVIYRNPDRFHRAELLLDETLYGPAHRMSVDTWADLEFMETLYARLTARGLPFDLPNAVRLLAEEPNLRLLNCHVHQRRIVEDIRKVLIVADAGGEYGYGHFMRCRELAGQLVERVSWPVTFLLDDARAAAKAAECGFGVLWGALGRDSTPAPEGFTTADPALVASGFGALIVDVSARRSPPEGWRASFRGRPVAVLDREDAFAREADLIVFPGVTGRARGPRDGTPPVVEGLDHAIIRREARRYAGLNLPREFDLLTYLYPQAQRALVDEAASARGWRARHLTGFSDEFPSLLARSRVFLSGFGQSFYEAAHLGVFPVAWPISHLHEADARAFYAALGVPPVIVPPGGPVEPALAPLLENGPPAFRPLPDGTPRVVEEIARMTREYAG